MGAKVTLEGLGDLAKDFDNLVGAFESRIIEREAEPAAELIAKDARRRAPRGPSGNLRRAIGVKKLRRTPHSGAVIAAVDRKIAPHAYWNEFGGRRERTPTNAQALYDDRTNTFFGKRVSRMPAQPFFRPAVHAQSGNAAERFEQGLAGQISKTRFSILQER